MRIYGRLLGYILHYKAELGLALMLALLGVLCELARPWPVKVVVDYMLSGHPLPAWLAAVRLWLPGAETAQGALVWSVVVGLAIVVGSAALSLAVLKLTVAVCQHLVNDLALELFERLQRLSLAYHSRHAIGDLLQRVSGDVFVIHFAISQVVLPFIVSLLTLAGMLVIMAYLDVTLALIALAVIPLLAVALLLFSKPMDATATRQSERQGALMELVGQSLAGIKLIQAFAREQYMWSKVEVQARDLGEAYRAAINVSGGYKEVTTAIIGVAAVLFLGLGGARVLAGQLSLGDLLIFLAYLSALYGPVNALSLAVGYAVAVVARGRRVFEVIDAQEEIRERPDALALGRVRGEVVFEHVSFGYEEERSPAARRSILRDVSFRARPGQVIAVVGATGAGKTSLVSLLTRFYDPWAGRILLDGQDVRDVTLASLRENISLVLQEPFLFPMSVADNIAFGRPAATRAEIIAAARVAHAHTFIERLPQGYDTVLEEAGIMLSGGERQRIALARAVLKDAPILILDEPTSALDAYTESLIFETLSHLMRHKTTFIISHRLSTIRRADQILALEDGRVAESGTHESLLAQGTVYANLYKHQHIAAL